MTLPRRLIDALLSDRQIARDDAAFTQADNIRDLLSAHGITVTDTPDGQIASHGTEAELRAAQSALTAANSRIAELEKREAAKRGQMLGASVHMQRTVTKLCEVKALLHEARASIVTVLEVAKEAAAFLPPHAPIDMRRASERLHAVKMTVDRIDAALTPDALGIDPIMDEVERLKAAALAAPAEVEALRAENERLRADAARYRWLRGDSCPDRAVRWMQWEVRCWRAPFWTGDLRRRDLDEAIDAAIAAASTKENT